MKKLKITGIAAAVIVIGAVAALAGNSAANNTVRLTEYTYSRSDVPDGFDGYKIFLISDLHEAPFADQIIEHIEETDPDVIIFCGDMVALPDYNFEQTQKIAERFNGSIPMYAVSGNHESQNSEYDHIVGNLWDAGIVWLENDDKTLRKNGDSIRLIGAEDAGVDVMSEEFVREEVIEEIEEYIPEDRDRFSILINHRADMYPYLKNVGVDLILSGHLHGGIVRLPLLGGVIGHEYADRFFPDYDYGYYEEGEAAMIVSGGCDQNPNKKRYFNPPEAVLITLEREDW